MTDIADRTPVPITADKSDTPHDPDALYIYRGCAIVGRPEGWDVLDATLPTPESDYVELGWGADMYEAMAVANFVVDGGARRKSR